MSESSWYIAILNILKLTSSQNKCSIHAFLSKLNPLYLPNTDNVDWKTFPICLCYACIINVRVYLYTGVQTENRLIYTQLANDIIHFLVAMLGNGKPDPNTPENYVIRKRIFNFCEEFMNKVKNFVSSTAFNEFVFNNKWCFL